MTHTAARVAKGGRQYTIAGPWKETTTDLTVTSNSETVTAAELGLNNIVFARADILTGQTGDTGTYANCAITTGGVSITLTEKTAAGAAATTNASTVIRVFAEGT